MPDARLAHNTKTPNPQAPDEHKLRAQGHSFEDVRRASDTRVIHDIRLIAHGLDDLLKRIQRGYGSIHLSAGVVRHYDAVTPDLNTLLGVLHALNPLDTKGFPAADPLPRLDEPRHPVPAVRSPMPDVVDPERTCAPRILLRVDSLLRESFLKHGVGETQIGTDAAVKGVVPRRDVVVAPAELPGVGREDARGEAGFVGSFQQGDRQFVVVRHVELVESGPGAIGFCDGFDGRRAGCAEAVGQVEFFGDRCDWEFAEGVVDFVDADWCETDWCRDFVAEDCGCGVAEVGVDELPGDDSVPEEGLTVSEVGVGLAGIG